MNAPVLYWFRRDLRLADNPALSAAAKAGLLIPVYIADPTEPPDAQTGAASRWWLHHTLQQFQTVWNGHLQFAIGDPCALIPKWIQAHGIQAVYWNRGYEPHERATEAALQKILASQGVPCHTFPGNVLWEPHTVCKPDGEPYRVFTPFYQRGCLQAPAPTAPLPAPRGIQCASVALPGSVPLATAIPLPEHPWHLKFSRYWAVGESAATQQWRTFQETGLTGYRYGRDFPAQPHVSRLSPYLHCGSLSPRQLWADLLDLPGIPTSDREFFARELAWREFSIYLLYHYPDLPTRNFQPVFDLFPWHHDPIAWRAWQQGQTGYPLVDAGMRELWETGYMHNRVRMVVGSFLVKNLLIDWRMGAQWFADCLVDADLASNSASWQWVAGSGADAAPYFRIFNPVTQAQKCDPDGTYIRRFVPALAQLEPPYLFDPGSAPAAVLQQAGVQLGVHYPRPLVDLGISRARALGAYADCRGKPPG